MLIPNVPPLDPRLTGYTSTNEPLPEALLPVLNTYLQDITHFLDLFQEESPHQSQDFADALSSAALSKLTYTRVKRSQKIRLIPLEIVAYILTSTLESRNRDRHQEDFRFVENDPFLLIGLRLVCKSWNEAALLSPELWRGLEVDLSRWIPNHSVPNLLLFTEQWFDRAGDSSAPVRLALTGAPTLPVRKFLNDNWSSFSGQLLSIVLAKRNWVEWHIDNTIFYSACLHKGGLETISKTFYDGSSSGYRAWQNVRQLSLGLTHDMGGTAMNLRGFGLFSAPNPVAKVQSIYIHSKPFTDPHTLQYLPSSSLRSLHLHQKIYLLPSFIAQISTLEELILESSDMTIHPWPNAVERATVQEAAEHTALQRLILMGPGMNMRALRQTFQNFTFPSLNLLRLAHLSRSVAEGSSETIRAGTSVLSFLARGAAPALTLSLEDSCLPPVVLREWLREWCNELGRFHVLHLRLDDTEIIAHAQPGGSDGTIVHFLSDLQTLGFRQFTGNHKPIQVLKILEGCSKLPRIYVPDLPELRLDGDEQQTLPRLEMALQYLSQRDMNKVFSYGIEGHHYENAAEAYRHPKPVVEEVIPLISGLGLSC